MLNSASFSIERQVFNRFLREVNTLLNQKRVIRPRGFISYAWEDPPQGPENKRLQAWLSQLKEDFAALNIDLFLDIQNINGNMRAAMREIQTRNFVFLIGTPRFKQRAEQDVLYLLPHLDARLLPTTSHAVVMVENDDKLYVIENNNQQMLLVGEIPLPRINYNQIVWKQEVGYRRAQSSDYVHQLIEHVIRQVSNRNITNVAYEFGLTLDKAYQQPQSLMPLLFQGDFGTAFPKGISTDMLIRDFRNTNDYYRQFVGVNPLGLLPALCPALQNDRDYARLVNEFLAWNFDIWKEQLANQFNDELQLYIPARGDYTADCSNPKPMEEHLREFMQNHSAKVMLLLGGSGSGKTCFGQYLSRQNAQQHYTPVWISLPALQNPKYNAIPEGLKLLGVPESQVALFKQKPLLIILDGYDEVKNLGNLFETNHLEEWNAKIIITCRTEFLNAKSYGMNFKPAGSSFVERHLAPFSPNEINAYLQKYIQLQNSHWTLAQYQAEMERLPVLKSLMETPFLLHIVADVLPDIADRYRGQREQTTLTRRALYERFIDQWFEKHIIRWRQQGKLALLDQGLELDPDDELGNNDQRINVLREYAEAFAHHLFSNQLDAVSSKAPFPWVRELFKTDERSKLIRSACLLKKIEDSYTFIHKSLIEYLITPRMQQEVETVISANNRSRNNPTSLVPPQMSLSHLNQQLLPPASIQFLADAIKEKPALQTGLWDIIYSTRQNNSHAIAAANAMTIFNCVRVSFSGRDLRGICIPGANLSGANLDNANFEGADLSNVNLTGVWLHGTDFTRAQMRGVEFGEYPSLLFPENKKGHMYWNSVEDCSYSPDGRYLALAIEEEAQLYDATTLALLRTFKGHTSTVRKIAFSSNSQLLATASSDYTQKIWNISNGRLEKTFEHEEEYSPPSCLAFSLNGLVLATGGFLTVKLWNVKSGFLEMTLKGHTHNVNHVVFSPNGEMLATGSDDQTLKLWNVKTGAMQKTFENTGDQYSRVIFSPDSQTLVTGNLHYNITLWHVQTGILIKSLKGHTFYITGIAFSPDGETLATGSWDHTIKLWNVKSGILLKTFEGHTGSVNCISFRPDGLVLASGSNDRTLRRWQMEITGLHKIADEHDLPIRIVETSLDRFVVSSEGNGAVKWWDIRNGTLQKVLKIDNAHPNNLIFNPSISLSLSPDGQMLATAVGWGDRFDGSINLWHIESGTLQKTFNKGMCVAFSPDGQMLATGGVEGTKIWLINGLLHKVLDSHTSCVKSIAFSPNRQMLAAGSNDGGAKVWHIINGTLLITFISPEYKEYMYDAVFSPDGQVLATRGMEGVSLWHITKGSLLKTLDCHAVKDFAFSPNGEVLATGRDQIQIWTNFTKSEEIPIFTTRVNSMTNSIAFHQNSQGTFLVSGHDHHSVLYWQLIQKNHKPYLQLLWTTHQNALFSLDACIEGARGLSENNAKLLQQRGAIGKPLMLSDAGRNAASSSYTGESSRRGAERNNNNNATNNNNNNNKYPF